MRFTKCPGCLKPGKDGYCRRCLETLFDGKRVSPILGFSRPDFNRVKNSPTSRISISGVQIKHSLRLDGKRLELTDTGGEYILKPVPNDAFEAVSEMPANEHVTMQMAGQLFKMKVAANAMVFFSDGEPAYLTRRFDRKRDGSRTLQEDFAQLTERTEESHGAAYKYDGSHEEIADLMRKHIGPYAIEVERLFDQVVFNYLILNGDAHLKNFSLFHDPVPALYRMTPAYDLVNSRLHIPDEVGDMALEMFKDDFKTASFEANAYYAKDDFVAFGERIGMQPKRIAGSMERFATGLGRMKIMIGESFLREDSKRRYLGLVEGRIGRLSYSYSSTRKNKEP